MEEFVKVRFLEFVDICVNFFVAVFDLLKPFLPFLLGSLYVVHLSVVVAVDPVFEVVREAHLGVLVVP